MLQDIVALERSESALTVQEKLFVTAYLERLDIQYAYNAAGYTGNSAHVSAYILLHQPHIQEYVQLCLKLRSASPWEIIARLTDISRGSLEDIADIGEDGQPVLNLRKAQGRGLMHTIESVHYSEKGRLIVRRYSAIEAMEKLAKIYRMFGDAQLRLDVKLLKVVLQAVPAESRANVLNALERYVHDGGVEKSGEVSGGTVIDVE